MVPISSIDTPCRASTYVSLMTFHMPPIEHGFRVFRDCERPHAAIARSRATLRPSTGFQPVQDTYETRGINLADLRQARLADTLVFREDDQRFALCQLKRQRLSFLLKSSRVEASYLVETKPEFLKLVHRICDRCLTRVRSCGNDDVEGKSAQRNDDEYRDQKGHRNPHQDAHVKSPSQRRPSLSWLPSLRPSTNIREVDLVHSFPVTLFLRRAVNNQSLVDAAFRYRKPESPYRRFRSTAASNRLCLVPRTRYLGECDQVIHEGAYLEAASMYD